MQFTFDAAFSRGVDLFKTRYGSLLAATLVFLLVLVGVSLAAAIIAMVMGIESRPNGQSWLTDLVNLFFTGPLSVGLLFITLLHLRGESPGIGTLFAGFKRYWPLVGINTLITIILLIPIAAAAFLLGFTAIVTGDTSAAVPAMTITAAVAGLVVFCICILLSTKLIFSTLLCIDPRTRLGVCASIATSWRMTGPVFWPLFGLLIVMGLILIGTTIVLVLPLFFVGIPLCLAITVAAYELLMSQQDNPEMESTAFAEDATAT